jgi:hypothetical protein
VSRAKGGTASRSYWTTYQAEYATDVLLTTADARPNGLAPTSTGSPCAT